MSETFRKSERLCRQQLVDRLFAEGQWLKPKAVGPEGALLRVRYLILPYTELLALFERSGRPVSRAAVLFSVPKKRFKRAVKRNRIRRQLREVYRLGKQPLLDYLAGTDHALLVAWLYNGAAVPSYADASAQVQELLVRLQKRCAEHQPGTAPIPKKA